MGAGLGDRRALVEQQLDQVEIAEDDGGDERGFAIGGGEFGLGAAFEQGLDAVDVAT